MHRRRLLEQLESYSRRYAEEVDTVSRFKEFITRCPDCFERSLEEGHLTGSAWLVDSTGEHVLLTHHRKLNIWVQLGGHADGDSDLSQVALKEAEEESGLKQLSIESEIFDIDIHKIPARKSDPEHFHYDVRFVVRHTGDGQYIVSEESHDLAWIKISDLEDKTSELSMLRMRSKWINNH